MLQDRVSNPGPLTCKSGVLPIALRDRATSSRPKLMMCGFDGSFPIRSIILTCHLLITSLSRFLSPSFSQYDSQTLPKMLVRAKAVFEDR